MPFDECKVWTDNLEYVAKALEIPAVHVLRVEDAGVIESDPSKRAKDVTPMEPAVYAFAAETKA
ncbi:MAG: hypothetical protein EOO65_03350 [Methanosarcinales archaeon]|nr:MAG: hypothetical protein EOO65_03350 [Methanosarcinales archaeon]